MQKLKDFVPDVDTALALAPGDFGIILLKICQQYKERNFTLSEIQVDAKNLPHVGHYPQEKGLRLQRVLGEAWQWLMNEGLVIEAPDQSSGYYCLTRKGAELKSEGDINTYRHGNVLPIGLLHPRLGEKVRPMFLRGDYDVAVFQAFKEVEVAVRKATRSSDSLVGVKLMRAAFKPDGGILTDKESDAGEQVALMELYAGAIGHCKNPTSHRNVEMERISAAQLIALASNLLTYVEGIELLRDIGLSSS